MTSRLRFGQCTFDPETRELLREGQVVSVSPQAFALLEQLVASRPKPMARRDLVARLWDGERGSESLLAALVLELRGKIEERGQEELFLRNMGSDGYAFVGKVEPDRRPTVPGAGYKYRLVWDDREIPLAEGANVIGRDYDALLRLDSPKVSRRHASVAIEGEEVRLEDLGSRNGTLLNDKAIEKPTRLADGDRIGIGAFLLVFRALPGVEVNGQRE